MKKGNGMRHHNLENEMQYSNCHAVQHQRSTDTPELSVRRFSLDEITSSERQTSSDSFGFEADSLARYDSLVQRISELESQRVELNVREAEHKYRGLVQTLHSYEGTLHELHRLRNERKLRTIKALGSFDLLGKKHKDKKVEARRQRELEAEREEMAQMDKISQLTCQVNEQKRIVMIWKTKARELDYVRQAESDLVDRVFRGQDAEGSQHDALEEAVCSLAPRIMAVRESCSNFMVLKSKCETAAAQLNEAVGALERSFQSPSKALREAFGEPQDRGHLDITDHKARLAALTVADKLVKLGALNLKQAQSRLALPLMLEQDILTLDSCLAPLLHPRTDLTTTQAEEQVEAIVQLITRRELEARRAAEEMAQMADQKNQEMLNVESMMMGYKHRLDNHRRELITERLPSLNLSDISMSRSQSAPQRSQTPPFSVYTEEEFEHYTRKHHTCNSSSALSSLSSMGGKSTSYSSDLFRMGSNT